MKSETNADLLLSFQFVNMQQAQTVNESIIYNNSALFTKKPDENNEFQPIVNHVRPKINLEMEHVLIGVDLQFKNRFWFSTLCVFSLRAVSVGLKSLLVGLACRCL